MKIITNKKYNEMVEQIKKLQDDLTKVEKTNEDLDIKNTQLFDEGNYYKKEYEKLIAKNKNL